MDSRGESLIEGMYPVAEFAKNSGRATMLSWHDLSKFLANSTTTDGFNVPLLTAVYHNLLSAPAAEQMLAVGHETVLAVEIQIMRDLNRPCE